MAVRPHASACGAQPAPTTAIHFPTSGCLGTLPRAQWLALCVGLLSRCACWRECTAPGTACGVPGTLEQRGWSSPAKVLSKSYQVLHGLQVLFSSVAEVLPKWHKVSQMLSNPAARSYQGLIWWSSSSPPLFGLLLDVELRVLI